MTTTLNDKQMDRFEASLSDLAPATRLLASWVCAQAKDGAKWRARADADNENARHIAKCDEQLRAQTSSCALAAVENKSACMESAAGCTSPALVS